MKSTQSLVFLQIFTMITVLACAKETEDKAVIAKVNGSPILLSELQKELSFRENQEQSPKVNSVAVADQVNAMIDRKLMIQEAIKMGLSEDERFAQTIKRYWEQTLIRNLIETKGKEWESKLSITEDEISQAYARMHYRMIVRAVRASDRRIAEDIADKIRLGKSVKNMERIGPVFYDDVKNTALENSFDMMTGETGIFPSAAEFVVIFVEKKQAINLPPLDGLRSQITQALLEQKRQQALDEWVDSLKGSSKITINKAVMESAYGE